MLKLLFFILSFFIGVNGKHFVLVHGPFHGAWSWYKVATMLKSAGHNVTTIELAGCGISPIQVQEIHSISQYYEPFMTFMESLPPKEKVILVGHSFGGIPLSVAMEKFPNKISVAVFITALVLSEKFDFRNYIQEDLTLGLSLVRPHPNFNDEKLLLKETRVTKHRYGRVPKVYIISKEDILFPEDYQMWVIGNTGPYVEVKVINGSDHMVMFSKPKKLTSHILKIAHKY
ncbi:methylesterase 8 isoform X2 [Medicago truncatula]|uniref:methylesterase 8 isoform X2 n=1 Tax=Medicago truncatula TaxID=3880 RepID=UPI000D2F166C|nr:methylesterase 8 isoform X2 [Medicago truncatula]